MKPVVFFVIVAVALSIATAVYAEHGTSAPFLVSASDDSSAAGPETSTTMPGLPATTTTTLGTAPPTTNPEELARNEALAEIPDEILAPLGGRDSVTLVAYDTIDESLEGWSGVAVDFTQGRAVLGKGVFSRSERLVPPFAVVGRVAYGAPGWFEITLDSGTWNTAEFRRWGVYGGADGFAPNVWEGNNTAGPEAVAIPTDAATFYWVVLAINGDNALYGVWEDGAEAEAIGETWEVPWDVAEWKLAMQVFPDSGVLEVDEYYVLTP